MIKFSKIVLFAAVVSFAVFAHDESSPNFRISGDFFLNPGYEPEKEWNKSSKDDEKEGDWEGPVDFQYSWNLKFGWDFGDKFSIDFRLSNPSGYAPDQLGEFSSDDGFKRYIPSLPNAYFTWRTGGVFSLKGGLLEVDGHTALDVAAGRESGVGLYTSFWDWTQQYNASQSGLKFGFDFSEDFSLNLTTILLWDEDEEEKPEENRFRTARVILDADIALGDMLTLTPMFALRSYYNNYESGGEEKSSIALAYGVDADIELSESFNLGVGLALGNVTGRGFYRENTDDKTKIIDFIAKVSPEISFGINEVELSYSLGLATMKFDGEKVFSKMYNDLALGWYFRINENIAFGPAFSMAFESNKPNGSDFRNSGTSVFRGGLEFVASF